VAFSLLLSTFIEVPPCSIDLYSMSMLLPPGLLFVESFELSLLEMLGLFVSRWLVVLSVCVLTYLASPMLDFVGVEPGENPQSGVESGSLG
jgi:hypothetical protein